MWSRDIGIDLGTATVIVFIKDKGVVLREPSVVAMDQNSGKILSVGEDAKIMISCTGNIANGIFCTFCAQCCQNNINKRFFVVKCKNGDYRSEKSQIFIRWRENNTE